MIIFRCQFRRKSHNRSCVKSMNEVTGLLRQLLFKVLKVINDHIFLFLN